MKSISMLRRIAIAGAMGIATVAGAKEVWVYWPTQMLRPAAEMDITEVELTVACGEFRAVRSIPPDWNIRVTRPISAVAEFSAEAGHGASSIPDMRALEGVIGILDSGESCFDVKARIVGIAEEHTFSKKQLKLRNRPAR